MDRAEIKNAAKAKIKGNLWPLLWPMLVIAAIVSGLTLLLGPKATYEFTDNFQLVVHYGTPLQYAFTGVLGIITSIIMAGYLKYVITFIRTGKFDTNDIINTIKAKWLDLLIANVLTMIIVGIGYALLVIPGIIASLALCLVNFLVVDKDAKGADSLKTSYELTKGHKGEIFVFGLSFIGWLLLVPITFGLIMIWLGPYMQVAFTMYYDKLAKQKN